MNYEDDAEQGMDDVEVDSESEAGYDGRTPLDKTIDRIGMGTLSHFLCSGTHIDQGVISGHCCPCADSVSAIL